MGKGREGICIGVLWVVMYKEGFYGFSMGKEGMLLLYYIVESVHFESAICAEYASNSALGIPSPKRP